LANDLEQADGLLRHRLHFGHDVIEFSFSSTINRPCSKLSFISCYSLLVTPISKAPKSIEL